MAVIPFDGHDVAPTAAEIGAALRSRRSSAGLTQAELAQKIGVTRIQIANFEKGLADMRSRFVFAAFHACRCVVKFAQPKLAT